LRTSGRFLIAATIGGALLAVVPILMLDRMLESYVEDHARDRLTAQARTSLGFAETRLESTITTLVDLAAKASEDCNPELIEMMRLTVFSNMAIKGVALLNDKGQPLCMSVNAALPPLALSREFQLADKRISIAVARIRDRPERRVHLRVERPNGRSMGALVAAEALLPEMELDSDVGIKRIRLIMTSGDLISARPAGDEGAGLDEGRSLTVEHRSERYPITVFAERSLRAIATEYQDLQFIVRFVCLFLALFALALFWLTVRRNQEDPLAALKLAMKNGEIVPFFQPTVDTLKGGVRGAEVLARWRKPDGTLVSPAHFIPLAEQSGLIYELTNVLMKRAIEEVGTTYAARPHLRLAFNLFAGHFEDGKIIRDVKSIFEGSPIAFDQIVLEVTERSPLPDLDDARKIIATLQEMGVRVAIDDVGTGHGGLSYLLKLGVDIIKIDKMFVDAISSERYSQIIIETLVELARTMNMEVIAEGVETFEQVEYLRMKGVGEAQGFVFAPPLPASSYLALVDAMDRPRSSIVENPLAKIA
jgi:sensor c-di-GMP phosphodiesterase-like protein